MAGSVTLTQTALEPTIRVKIVEPGSLLERVSGQHLPVIDSPSEIESPTSIATLKNKLLEIYIPKALKTAAARVEIKPA